MTSESDMVAGRSGLRPAQLLVSNMHCPSCVEAITQLLEPVVYVKDLSVNLLQRTVTFQVDTGLVPSGSTGHADPIDEVSRLLQAEGGFAIDTHSPTIIGTSRKPGVHHDSWMERFPIGREARAEKRRREAMEERRRRHLERCEVCRQELTGSHPSTGSPPVAAEQKTSPSPSPSPSPPPTSPPCLQDAVRTTLSIEGMTCASCTRSITSALKSHPDVLDVEVSLLSSSGLVRHRSTLAPEAVAELVEEAGFEASVVRTERTAVQLDVPPQSNGLKRTTLAIEGMTCASCSSAIQAVLKDKAGVESVSVDVLGNSAVVVHHDELSPADIKEEIEDIGYGAEVVSTTDEVQGTKEDQGAKGKGKASDDTRTIDIAVQGIFCGDCVSKLNAYLATLPFVSFTPFTLARQSTTVSYLPHQPLTIRDILAGLSGVAPEFTAEVVRTQTLSDRSQEIQRKEVRKLAWHLGVAIVFAIPTFVIAIVGMVLLPSRSAFRTIWMKPVWGAANLGTVVLWPLATIVQFGVGRLFYERAFHSIWPSLRALAPSFLLPRSTRRAPRRPLSWRSFFSFGSMDLLVTLSTTTSYFASIAMLIIDVLSSPSSESIGTYFDSSVFLIMFILLGRTLEAYAKSRTTDAISLLGSLRPETALLVDSPSASAVTRKEAERSSSSISAQELPPIGEIEEKEGSAATAGSMTPAYPSGPREVPVDHLERGDLILVPPGALPPTDGIVVAGSTTFDESSLTGESRPIRKSPGDEIFTGTTNLSGAITLKVTDLGGETMLSKIISAVSDASARKAPIEKLAERLTGVFVPIIVYLSLIVLAIWLGVALTGHVDGDDQVGGGRVFFAIEFAIAVLVVACPCGIGLAVPCANAVGNGIAARAGILASGGGEAFVAATRVGTVAFDKTGTLTIGKSVVTDEIYASGQEAKIDDTVVKALIREVEGGSTHPLAKGLVEYLAASSSDDKPPVVHIVSSDEIAGRGVSADVKISEGRTIRVLIGNLALMHQHGVTIDPAHLTLLDAWSGEAKSVVLVSLRAEDSQVFSLRAMYALSDPPREETKDVIADLRKRGMRVIMLSGDNGQTANAVAKMVGIRQEDVWAGVGPEGKAQVIRDLQRERPQPQTPTPTLVGRLRKAVGGDKDADRQLVMFVGDGLNDSVALAASDASVAMGHGSQSTLASASFVLLSSSLSSLPTLLHISLKVRNRQRLNLAWALVFNVVCLPFAAGVFYPAGHIRLSPVWSAVLMALSSVSVVLSSLALRWGL